MRLRFLLVAVSLAVGCGSMPTTTEKPTPGLTRPPADVPATPADPSLTPDGVAKKAVAAYHALPAFAAQMRYFEKNGGKSVSRVYDAAGKPPRTLRLHILQGDGAGTKLLWTGGTTAKVRAAGLLGAVTVDLNLSDDRLRGPRGWRLDEADFSYFISRLASQKATVKLVGQNAGAIFLDVTGPHLLPGIVRMNIALDSKTYLPKQIEEFDAKELVFRVTLPKFRPMRSVSLEI